MCVCVCVCVCVDIYIMVFYPPYYCNIRYVVLSFDEIKTHYKSLDLNELKADMARAPWHIIGALEDIDDSVFLWESLFKSILDNHIEKRIVKIRDRSLP